MDRKTENLQKLGLTDAEIADVLKADAEIDHGKKLFELPDELKAGAKKAKQADRKQTVPVKRERKPDEEKRKIIQTLVDVLMVNSGCATIADSVEIINPEREFLFTVGEKKYKIVLSCPRK